MFNEETSGNLSTSHLHIPPRKRGTNKRERDRMLAKAMKLLKEVSIEFNIDVKSLQHRATFSHFILARKAFVRRGRALGLSVMTLGRALHRDHTTISYHASDLIRERKDALRKKIRPRKCLAKERGPNGRYLPQTGES